MDLNSPALNSSIPEQNTRVLFGLSGDAADTNALADISTIVITQSKDGAAAETVPGITVTLAGDEKSATWSVSGLPRIPGSMADSVPLTTASDGEYEYVITATDVSGKTRQRTASVRFDRTEPVMAISTAIPATWFPLAAFPISGTNSDGGSGIGAVEYSLDGTNFSALSFTTTNWSGTIPVSSGVNTIRLRISDRAGNQTVLPDQTLNVDLEAPSVVVTDPSEILRVRSGMDIPITFDAWDENPGSGLQSVSVTRVGSQTLATPPSVAYTGDMSITGGTITLPWATLDALAPALVDGTQYVVTVRATDRGERTGSSTFSFVYDATPPSVAIAAPALSDPATLLSQTINQTVTVSGTASDTQMLRAINSVSLDIVDGSGTVLMNLDTFSGAAANTWSYNLDTTNATVLSHGTAVGLGTRIILRATAWDAAGNTNFVDRPVTINQESDRPVITLSNLITDPTDPDYPSILQMIKTVYGSVLDDDGITSVQANNGDGWTVVPLTGSGFTYTTTGTDGSKSLSFRIVDSAGRTFETGTATQPQFVNGTGFVDGPVPYSVDTVYPEIFATIRVDTQTPYDFAAGVSDLTTNKPFGGSTAVFALEVRASDANGIDTVSVTVPGAPGSPYVATASGLEAGFTIFRTGPIDVSTVPDGAVVVTALVTDKSGLEKSSSNTILVDNTVPTVTNDYPRMGVDQVNGLLDISGQALDSGSGLFSVEYNLGYDYASQPWAPVSGTFSWKISFVGAAPPDVGEVSGTIEQAAGIISVDLNPDSDLFTAPSHGLANGTPVWLGAETLPTGHLAPGVVYYVIDSAADTFRLSASSGGAMVDFTDAGLAIYVSAKSSSPAGDNFWQLPVFIRATDNAGNVYTTAEWAYRITVDPSGDKPKAYISYPDTTPSILGGIIRINGYAEDDDAVDSVYMQIDVNGDGLFTALDVAGATDWYSGGEGRPVTGGTSWRQSINESQEFNPVEVSAPEILTGIVYRITELGTTDFTLLGAPAGFVVGTEFTATSDGNAGSGNGRAEPTKRTIHFRVRAKDIYGTFGAWTSAYQIDVDKNVPKFGYTNAFTLTQGTIERLYQPDMWVRGSWVLSGTIEDESGIDRIEISSIVTGSGSSIPVSLTENPRVSFTNGTTGDQGYELSIQIPTAALPAGNTLAVTITAFDNSTPQMSAQQTFSIKYDNIAPTINAYEGVTPVVNTNYLYEAKGSVVETGSGFERVFVYFQRTGTVSGVDRIYNPMLPVPDSRVNTSDLNFVLDSDVPLFAIPTFTKTSTTLQSASLANNDNVRVGSVVYLDGLYCRITDYNSGTGTITWDEDVSQAVTNAAIVYALVLDNTTAEYPVWAPDYSSYTITNDDGDGLIESVTSAGALYEWKTSVDSRNIPDGNITVHYVAFDKAGNKAHGSQATSVRNNPPLLAKVTLATDLSG
ncbi:MAG TPA: Ig-like domain repeat protein, partial [Treponemataceae bacterium]|nr:Ig-like domain repeat protein [Treponemataceae bacterium]